MIKISKELYEERQVLAARLTEIDNLINKEVSHQFGRGYYCAVSFRGAAMDIHVLPIGFTESPRMLKSYPMELV